MKTKLVGNTHLIQGDATTIPRVLELLDHAGTETRRNPDLYIRTYDRFGINEARELRERASSRAIAGDRRAFVIATPSMTSEAQNALLKTLEEPPADALFFFIVPAPEMLLATLRSRMQMLALPYMGVKQDVQLELVDAKQFLAATPMKRLDMLKPLLEKDEDEKRDIGAIITFLSSLERRLTKSTDSSKRDALHAVYRARKYIGDKGALVKPLLEQVAFLVPKV